MCASTCSSQTIAAALRSAAEQLGVEVQCGARVQSITTVECPAPALVARHTVERDGEAGETAQEGPGPRRFSVAYTTRAVQSSPASPTASPSTRTSASSPSAPTLTSLECDRVIVATGSARCRYVHVDLLVPVPVRPLSVNIFYLAPRVSFFALCTYFA